MTRSVDKTRLAAKGNPKAVQEYLLARHFEDAGRGEDLFQTLFFDPEHPVPGEEELNRDQAAILHVLRENTRWKRSEILKAIEPHRGLAVLDAGCGFGGIAYSLSMAGANVGGLDVDRDRLATGCRIAKRLKQPLALLQGDIRRLPFPDRSFDAIVLADVLEHVREKRQVLAEAHRVLRERGRVVVHTDNKTRIHLGVWARRAIAVVKLQNPLHWNVPWAGQAGGHVALTTPHRLKRLMENSGFVVRLHAHRKTIPFLSYLLAPSFFFIGVKRRPITRGREGNPT